MTTVKFVTLITGNNQPYMKEVYNVKNVERKVKKAISKYCRDNGITQARYLAEDRRLKGYLV